MALINCTECNHQMSDQAKTCPNCFVPRRVSSTKTCTACGCEMEARKKKCTECGYLQNSASKTETNHTKQTTMAQKKESNSIILPLIAGILIGIALFFGYNSYFPEQLSNDYARVQRYNGLHIFLHSEPLNKESYEVLQAIEANNAVDVISNAGIGKEKAGKVFKNLFTGGKSLGFKEKLHNMTEQAKQLYPDADGIIFSNDMVRGQVIKFN